MTAAGQQRSRAVAHPDVPPAPAGSGYAATHSPSQSASRAGSPAAPQLQQLDDNGKRGVCTTHARPLPPYRTVPIAMQPQAPNSCGEPGPNIANGRPHERRTLPLPGMAPECTEPRVTLQKHAAPQRGPQRAHSPNSESSQRSRSPSERFKSLGVVLEADDRTRARLDAATVSDSATFLELSGSARTAVAPAGSENGNANAQAAMSAPYGVPQLNGGAQTRTALGQPYMPLGRDYPDSLGASSRVHSPTRRSGAHLACNDAHAGPSICQNSDFSG